MSGFDEEAERERLREKYEQDQEKRAATQRMSELLLKGATMTNSHCDTCGDPLFRYDGQTFCPTCQAAEREASADAGAGAGAEAEVDGAAAADTESTADAEAAAGATSASTDATRDRPAPPSAGDEPPADAADGRVRELAEGGADAPHTAREPSTRPSPSADAADLDDVRASLSRTLARYTHAAEETDDPRRARELLAAAREAAETLAALDRR